MNELKKIQDTIDTLKEENKKLKEEIVFLKEILSRKQSFEQKEVKREIKKENYFTKYRTLYMKYKHQQNNFEKTNLQYKEVIRLLQAEIIQNASNEELFEKVEKLNKLGV